PRARPQTASVGPGRLADTSVALPVRADAHRLRTQQAAAHFALEDPRQPAAEPGRARDAAPPALRVDGAAGRSESLDARDARGADLFPVPVARPNRRQPPPCTPPP